MKPLDRIARAAERKGLAGGQLAVAARPIIERHLSSMRTVATNDGGIACRFTFDTEGFLEELADALERDGPGDNKMDPVDSYGVGT